MNLTTAPLDVYGNGGAARSVSVYGGPWSPDPKARVYVVAVGGRGSEYAFVLVCCRTAAEARKSARAYAAEKLGHEFTTWPKVRNVWRYADKPVCQSAKWNQEKLRKA